MTARADDAERLIAVDSELRTRDRIDREAADRVGHIEHRPEPLDRAAAMPTPHEAARDVGIDLGP